MKIKNTESLCLIYSPDLTNLNYPDDLAIRSAFNYELSQHLKSFLRHGDKTYGLTGHGMFVKLKESNETRLYSLYQIVNAYQFSWKNNRINFHCGVSYTAGDSNSKTAILIFDLLSSKIHLSLKNRRPERIFLNEN